MPADITINADGSAAAIYGSRKPAWHRLGKVEDGLFTAKHALHATGLDFGIETTPIFIEIDGVKVVDPEHRMTYRMLDGVPVPLGVVGTEYQATNPVDLFEFMDDVIGQIDGAHYDAAFALRNWKQVVCVADVGSLDLDPEGRNDKILQYLVGRSSADGSWQFGIKFDNVRPECANMMAVHLRKATTEWKTRHTTNIRRRIEEAKVVLGMQKDYQDEWAEGATQMIQTEITDTQFDRWLDGLMEATKKQTGEDEIDRAAMFAIRSLNAYSPTSASIKGTVWGALNAATEFSDWGVEVKEGKSMSADETRFARQIGDAKSKYSGDFKQLAWDFSLGYLDGLVKGTVGVGEKEKVAVGRKTDKTKVGA